MGDIADLESRLSAALDRIAQGVDQLGADQSDAAVADVADQSETVIEQATRIAELENELAAERTAKAALEAQVETLTEEAAATANTPAPVAAPVSGDVDALNKAHADELEYMRSVSAAEREAWKGLNSRLVRMRRTNRLMRYNAATMRKAAEDKVVDADAINQSLQAELEALQAAQEVERAETDVILKTLQPLLGDPVNDTMDADSEELH
ncbi:MAG: hypothetical protein JXQ85_06335 [Cognatishimia sp.]|uniref:hypothetical protein n=1 Tax=Cognatishimia sp. TaxID=2211648 RepID=UPI003B8B6F7C